MGFIVRVRAGRTGVAVAGAAVAVAVALIGVAAPASAAPRQSAQAVQALVEAAPAPTGLTYTYDAARQTVTVTWDAKAVEDTVTRNYRVGNCGPTPQYPCFVAPDIILGNSFSFTMAPGSAPRYIKVYAENASHQLTGSQVLTVAV
ncbi:hypothetical protein ACFW9D_26940 [Streptomyces sp. NPDC059524]|uniref:hypothetical protein n=1 Tax=Streptomyces sp. NPDC059524 TaxID=3346856 RepID=UPI0036AEA530